jgi:hypothetical protein
MLIFIHPILNEENVAEGPLIMKYWINYTKNAISDL